MVVGRAYICVYNLSSGGLSVLVVDISSGGFQRVQVVIAIGKH